MTHEPFERWLREQGLEGILTPHQRRVLRALFERARAPLDVLAVPPTEPMQPAEQLHVHARAQ